MLRAYNVHTVPKQRLPVQAARKQLANSRRNIRIAKQIPRVETIGAPQRWAQRNVALAAVVTAPGSKPNIQEVQLVDKVLWVRKISWSVNRQAVAEALSRACPSARHVEVVDFTRRQRIKLNAAQVGDHRGFAFVVFEDAAQARAAAAELEKLTELGELQVSSAPAPMLPRSWSPELLMNDDEVAAAAAKVEMQERQRGHRTRHRERKRQRHVESLEDILSSLGPPGGLGAVSTAYASICPDPSLLSSHSVDWSEMPEACQVSVMTVTLEDGDSDSDGSDMEWASQEAMGKEPPLPKRVLRKRDQVESCALVLRQLLGQGIARPVGQGQASSQAPPSSLAAAAGQQTGAHHISSPGPTTQHPGQQHPSSNQPAHTAQISAHTLTGPGASQPAGVPRPRIVDFGSGSGNMLLPLAYLLPGCDFHAVDMNSSAIALLSQRAQQAGLSNVTASVGRIEELETGSFDVALALHACGNATDYALLQAVRYRAAYVVSPCCVGKLKFSSFRKRSGLVDVPLGTETDGSGRGVGGALQQGQQEVQNEGQHQAKLLPAGMVDIKHKLSHPRSRWMSSQLEEPAASFQILARAADISHSREHSHADLAVLAKLHVELDRNSHMGEEGYNTTMVKLLRPHLFPFKSDVLVGVPGEKVAGGVFAWPWK